MCNNSGNVTGNVTAILSCLSRICYAEEKTNGDNSGWGEEGRVFGSKRFARVELNGKPDVASETQDRMLSVLEGLGYITRLVARSMPSRAKNLVGLIVPDITFPFAVGVMQGMNRAIGESTFDPLVCTTDNARKSGNAHTNPRIGRRNKSHGVAADHRVHPGCRTSDYQYH